MKFPLYSEDSSNQFGDPNSLDTTGGLFDTLPEKESRSQSDQPPSDRASESDLPSGGAPVEEEEPKPVIQDKAPVSGNSGRKSDKAQPRKKKSTLLPMIAGMILLAAVACIAVLLGTNDTIIRLFSQVNGRNCPSKIPRYYPRISPIPPRDLLTNLTRNAIILIIKGVRYHL